MRSRKFAVYYSSRYKKLPKKYLWTDGFILAQIAQIKF